jgi:hypothetical protein
VLFFELEQVAHLPVDGSIHAQHGCKERLSI